jgi:CRP-like cAMP-binding protein
VTQRVEVRRHGTSSYASSRSAGQVEITADGNRLATRGPGELFGELPAIDWGAGFARTRVATVTATEPTRLLVLVNRLMKSDPAFAARLERASRERLATL